MEIAQSLGMAKLDCLGEPKRLREPSTVSLDPDGFVRFMLNDVIAIRRVARMYRAASQGPFRTIGTMYSGSDMPILRWRSIIKGLHDWAVAHSDCVTALPEAPHAQHLWSCESLVAEQEWIRRNFDPLHIFANANDMCKPEVWDIKGSAWVRVQDPDVLVAGTLCRDYSTYNRARNSFTSSASIGRGFGKSGESVQALLS